VGRHNLDDLARLPTTRRLASAKARMTSLILDHPKKANCTGSFSSNDMALAPRLQPPPWTGIGPLLLPVRKMLALRPA